MSPEKIELRGLVNLLVLILLSYSVRAVVTSLEENDFVITKEVALFRVKCFPAGKRFHCKWHIQRSSKLPNWGGSAAYPYFPSDIFLD